MSQPWDYIAKIVSIGDSGTGKSSLTIRLCEGRFQSHHDVTIGVEFGSRILPVGPPASLELRQALTDRTNESTSAPPASQQGAAQKSKQKQKQMKLSLWDTAGQETYKSITRSYFRGASGALLVFDISRRQTFESATTWLNDLRQIAEDGIVVVLVGNKCDLDETPAASSASKDASKRKREVSKEEAEEWARSHNLLAYVETSAKSGLGVESAFREVAERIYQGIEAGRYNLDDRRSGVKRAGTVGAGNVKMTVDFDDARGATSKGSCC